MVALQLQDKLDYLDSFQSGLCPRYGTETALSALLDDLWQEQDGSIYPSLLFLTSLASFQCHQPWYPFEPIYRAGSTTIVQ